MCPKETPKALTFNSTSTSTAREDCNWNDRIIESYEADTTATLWNVGGFAHTAAKYQKSHGRTVRITVLIVSGVAFTQHYL